MRDARDPRRQARSARFSWSSGTLTMSLLAVVASHAWAGDDATTTSRAVDSARDTAPSVIHVALVESTMESEAADVVRPEPGAPETVADRLASTSDQRGPSRTEPSIGLVEPPTQKAIDDPIVRAKRIMADCRDRYLSEVSDYSCLFLKREWVNGRLTPQYSMTMKARVQPMSVYIKMHKPDSRAGREAIYVDGRHSGKALVHDVGWGKLLGGTIALDPRSRRAMDDCRHPISEAGLGYLLDTLVERWNIELTPGETEMTIRNNGVKVDGRPCLLIVSTHPQRKPGYMFHSVKIYIDQELGLPIRFEAYDWPSAPGKAPQLLEEYTYLQLRLNVGLSERDFDPSNAQYSFGRF